MNKQGLIDGFNWWIGSIVILAAVGIIVGIINIIKWF